MNNQRNSYFPQYTPMQASKPATAYTVSHTPSDCANLLAAINKASFAMDDTRLFLDTHPDCTEALEYFKKMEHMRDEAIKEYEHHVGPMLAYHSAGDRDGCWFWNQGPLPWENACCNGRRV